MKMSLIALVAALAALAGCSDREPRGTVLSEGWGCVAYAQVDRRGTAPRCVAYVNLLWAQQIAEKATEQRP